MWEIVMWTYGGTFTEKVTLCYPLCCFNIIEGFYCHAKFRTHIIFGLLAPSRKQSYF